MDRWRQEAGRVRFQHHRILLIMSSSFKDISVGTSSAKYLSRPFRCSVVCRVCETTLTTSEFWLEEPALLLSNLPLQVASPEAWFHFSSHCPFLGSSCWQNFQLALLEFFDLKRRNRSPVFIPASSGKCQIVICWEFAQGKILLIWNEKKEEHINLFPKLIMDFGWMLWDSASLDLLDQEKKTKNAAGRGNFKKIGVERTLLWTRFYDQIPRMQTARGRTNCLT